MRKLLQPILCIIFFISIFLVAVCIASTTPICLLFPERVRYRVITSYSWVTIYLAKLLCGIHFSVQGKENLPKNQACIVMAKHQSMWETLFFQTLLPPQCWVLKQELLYIPFFGWGLWSLSPIAINRNDKHKLKQIIKIGKEKLKNNWWVVIFPEGTRVQPGESKKFTYTAAFLAKESKYPVVPITHNAGVYWPKSAIFLKPGTIQVTIGKSFTADELSTREINERVQQWMQDNEYTISRII